MLYAMGIQAGVSCGYNNIRFLERISKLYALTIKSNVMNKIMTSKAKNSF